MKPKVFIGSSVEGLSVAYAIQQNLTRDAEPTVWDQGVFELSRTTIESLTASLDASDFGVFVFSPDDVVTMRGKENNAVRDNVLFEFGLFIGKLGRDKVFFIMPDGGDLHLPTDLLGITAGTYNPSRDDGSLQAATAPACNQIRQIIKKTTLVSPASEVVQSEETQVVNEVDTDEWLVDFLDENYPAARARLEKKRSKSKGAERIVDDIWTHYIDYKEKKIKNLEPIVEIGRKNCNSNVIVALVGKILNNESYEEIAIELLGFCLPEIEDKSEILVIKSDSLNLLGNIESAISMLEASDYIHHPLVAIKLSELHTENSDEKSAIECLGQAFIANPREEELAYRYARLLQGGEKHKEALYLLNLLTEMNPNESSYWGYLSNTCLQLDLYDKAMSSCKTALDLTDGKGAWLLNNIGNMYKNRGFYSEAESWLNKGISLDPTSQYAHDRLSTTLRNKKSQEKKFITLCKEGRVLLKNTGSKKQE